MRAKRHLNSCFIISIHAPRVGSDDEQSRCILDVDDFNPRSPRGERPAARPALLHALRHFNPRSPRGERPHAFRCVSWHIKFQSTLPAWGATYRSRRSVPCLHFNPRSPRGERRELHRQRRVRLISIHAPRVGSDLPLPSVSMPSIQFQSTLPAWGATQDSFCNSFDAAISIHAPRVGSDQTLIFDATDMYISIHAPRVGSDSTASRDTRSRCKFQSTLPAWGATCTPDISLPLFIFQSTLPAWGAT